MSKSSSTGKKQTYSEASTTYTRVKRVKYSTEQMADRIQHLVDKKDELEKKRKRSQREIYIEEGIKCSLAETSEEALIKVELRRLRNTYRMRVAREKTIRE